MPQMQLRQRWMPWPWGIFGLGLAMVLAGIGVYAAVYFPEERPGVRLVIPMFALAVYWVLALLCNRRTVALDARGIRLVIGPFFVRLPQRAPRDQIRRCYVRRTDIVDDGTLLETYYSVGIETIQLDQIDVSLPHTEEEARRLAGEVANVLNQAPGEPLEIADVAQIPPKMAGTLLLAGFWLALFIAAIFVGWAWEAGRP